MKTKRVLAGVTAAVALLVGSGAVIAGSPPLTSPQTQNFQVKLTITEECKVGTISDLDFTPGTGVGFVTTALTQQTTISIGCTKDTVATVALGDGSNYDAGNGTRRMSNGTDFISYNLYTANDYATVWNSTNTQTATGNGAISAGAPALNQTLTVYGRVPAQNTGSVGAYSDTITATVEF